MIRRILVSLAMAIALAACSGGNAKPASPTRAPLIDPASPGPYAVGLTHKTFERAGNADGKPRVLDTWIWYPAAGTPGAAIADDAPPATGGPFPLIVFSHGSGGEPQFYRFITEHLASWGFIVAAPPHPGNTSGDCPCDGGNIVASARERPDDVAFVLDQMLALRNDASQPLGAIVDLDRAGIAGHSFGGWTSLFVAPNGRFDAALALAPGLPESLIQRSANDQVPLLIIGGGRDEIVPAGSVQKLWESLPSGIDRTYVSLPEGRHLTFIDRCLNCTVALTEARGHELTNGYATAFFMTELARDSRYSTYLQEPQPPDALLVGR